jgi:hypothetical protein
MESKVRRLSIKVYGGLQESKVRRLSIKVYGGLQSISRGFT